MNTCLQRVVKCLYYLFFQKNATLGKRMKVDRGIKSSERVGKVLEFDGKTDIRLWSTAECNQFRGTDGWIIPPLLKAEDGISFYSIDLCR